MADRPEIEEARRLAVQAERGEPLALFQYMALGRAFLDLLGKQSEREKESEEILRELGWTEAKRREWQRVRKLAPLPEQSEHARFVCSACGSRSNKQRSTMDVPLPEQSEEEACHICGEPRNKPGKSICSYPHPLVADAD